MFGTCTGFGDLPISFHIKALVTQRGRGHQHTVGPFNQGLNQGFGRVINITSGAVKAPISVLGLSNGARSGLTGFVAGLARRPEYAANNVTINNLLPGKFDTDRINNVIAKSAETQGISVEQAKGKTEMDIPAHRLGSREEFGAFCAFLCSGQAAYFTGQNLLLDGGNYPGSF